MPITHTGFNVKLDTRYVSQHRDGLERPLNIADYRMDEDTTHTRKEHIYLSLAPSSIVKVGALIFGVAK